MRYRHELKVLGFLSFSLYYLNFEKTAKAKDSGCCSDLTPSCISPIKEGENCV